MNSYWSSMSSVICFPATYCHNRYFVPDLEKVTNSMSNACRTDLTLQKFIKKITTKQKWICFWFFFQWIQVIFRNSWLYRNLLVEVKTRQRGAFICLNYEKPYTCLLCSLLYRLPWCAYLTSFSFSFLTAIYQGEGKILDKNSADGRPLNLLRCADNGTNTTKK